MKAPLKIALINDIWPGGAARCARDLAHGLSASHVVRYYPRQGKETVDSILTDLTKFQPDIVHCHGYYGDLPYHFLATISRRYPTCFTAHDPQPIGLIHPSFIECWECPHTKTCLRCPLVSWRRRIIPPFNPYFRQRLSKWYTHWRSAKTLQVITPSFWLKQRFMATELRRFPLHHIPNAIDLQLFRPIPDARDRLGLPLSKKIILYVAQSNGWDLNFRKGLKYLAAAFVERVFPQYPEAQLLVAGDGLAPNHPNVKPLGTLSQEVLPLYYAAVDLFVSPTLADNLPYTILESMGCGTPVVASRVGGVPEEIEDGVTGYLCPPADAQALGMALVAILEDKGKLRAMGKAARLRVERIFNMEIFLCKHEKLYYTMLG